MGFNVYGEVFSKVYDKFWDEFIIDVGPQIIKLFDTSIKSKENKLVLDLFCGTGRLAKILLDGKYEVIGIDLSLNMLNIAKKRNQKFIDSGKALFLEENAEDFTLNKQVGFVACTFDSINHLQEENALRRCFESVYSCLEDGGTFLFDLNTKKGLKTWNFIDIEETEDAVFIMHGKYDGVSKQAYTKAFGFLRKKDNLFEKFEEIMYNTIFSLNLVKQLLLEIGWKNVYYTKEDNLFQKLTTNPENELRVFVIAEK